MLIDRQVMVPVFPARAGMSPAAFLCLFCAAGVPRASGDEPSLQNLPAMGPKCSPRERG